MSWATPMKPMWLPVGSQRGWNSERSHRHSPQALLVTGFQHERLERSLAGDQFLHDPLLVVRMKPLAPVERDGFLER